MKVHANAALGPAGRLALVEAIESGMTQKAAAAAFCVAPATAHRWWHRWRLADEEQRSSGRYYNRRRPHSSLGDRPPISRVHNVRG
jgi:transposase InsO family protein